jgi:hypothetical protein
MTRRALPWRKSAPVNLDRIGPSGHVRFSNRPFLVKHFQTIHQCDVDVAHGLVLLFGIGTRALHDHLLEVFDGKTEIAIRLTVQPEKTFVSPNKKPPPGLMR